jgi:hypothetical protein
MSPEGFQKRLRTLPLGGDLVVKRDPHYAVRHGYHPDAYQIWDKGRVSGRPYCVLVAQLRGVPVELDDRIYARVARMQVQHNGRPGWVDDKVREFMDADEQTDVERDRVFHETWKDRIDVRGKVRSMFGKTKKWALNKSILPETCASQNSSPPSGTE